MHQSKAVVNIGLAEQGYQGNHPQPAKHSWSVDTR